MREVPSKDGTSFCFHGSRDNASKSARCSVWLSGEQRARVIVQGRTLFAEDEPVDTWTRDPRSTSLGNHGTLCAMMNLRASMNWTMTLSCAWLLCTASCKSDDDGGADGEFAGLYDACQSNEDCAETVPEDAEGQCIGQLEDGGFCTWSCVDDSDCSEEFDEDFDYLCSSFESETGKFCFPGCREDDPDIPEDEVCPAGYECRSTGGGAQNRRICFPSP